ncbi:unnamed protein product [Amoebophrya sp. A120]|nr:unnamed protein product [Amoebophrya sp. A120]|eukprot:GSA120T00009367001.1
MGGCVSYVKRRVRRRLRPGEEAEHQYLGQNFDDGIALEQGGGALAGHQNQQTIGTRPGAGLVTRSATLTSRLTAANNISNRNSQNTNPNQFKSVDELVSSGIKEAQLAIEMSGRGKRKQAAKHQQKARELLQLALVKGQNPHLKFHLQAVLQKLGVVDLEWASISNQQNTLSLVNNTSSSQGGLMSSSSSTSPPGELMMLPNNARNSAMSPFGTTTTGILPNDDGTSNNPMMLEDINLMDDDQNSSDGEASIAYEQLRFTDRGLLDDYDLDFSTEDLFNEGSSVSSENVRDNINKSSSSQMIGDRNLGAAASNTTPASSIAGAGGMMLNNSSAPSGGPQQKKSKKKKIAGSAAVSSSSHRNTSNNSSLSSPLALTASAASPHLGNATAVGSGQNINASSNTTSSNVSSPMMLHQQQVTMRNIKRESNSTNLFPASSSVSSAASSPQQRKAKPGASTTTGANLMLPPGAAGPAGTIPGPHQHQATSAAAVGLLTSGGGPGSINAAVPPVVGTSSSTTTASITGQDGGAASSSQIGTSINNPALAGTNVNLYLIQELKKLQGQLEEERNQHEQEKSQYENKLSRAQNVAEQLHERLKGRTSSGGMGTSSSTTTPGGVPQPLQRTGSVPGAISTSIQMVHQQQTRAQSSSSSSTTNAAAAQNRQQILQQQHTQAQQSLLHNLGTTNNKSSAGAGGPPPLLAAGPTGAATGASRGPGPPQLLQHSIVGGPAAPGQQMQHAQLNRSASNPTLLLQPGGHHQGPGPPPQVPMNMLQQQFTPTLQPAVSSTSAPQGPPQVLGTAGLPAPAVASSSIIPAASQLLQSPGSKPLTASKIPPNIAAQQQQKMLAKAAATAATPPALLVSTSGVGGAVPPSATGQPSQQPPPAVVHQSKNPFAPQPQPDIVLSVKVLNGVDREEQAFFQLPLSQSSSEKHFFYLLDQLCQSRVGCAVTQLQWMHPTTGELKQPDVAMIEEIFGETNSRNPMLILYTMVQTPAGELPVLPKLRLKKMDPSTVDVMERAGKELDKLLITLETSKLQQATNTSANPVADLQQYQIAFTDQWTGQTVYAEVSKILPNKKGLQFYVPQNLIKQCRETQSAMLLDVHVVCEKKFRSENRRALSLVLRNSSFGSSSDAGSSENGSDL